MKLRDSIAATASCLIAISAAAPARAVEPGYYGTLQGGLSFAPDIDVDGSLLPPPNTTPNLRLKNDTGWSVLGAMGRKFGDQYPVVHNWRFELEMGLRSNESTIAPSNFTGKVKAFTIMGNALYDIPTGSRFTPYVGVGMGAVNIKYSIEPLPSRHDWAFGYQAIIGVGFALTKNIEIFSDYHYLGTTGTSDNFIRDNYENHLVLAGLRWRFWEEPVEHPPAPVATAVAERRTDYVVYFEFNKYRLTPEAQEVIAQAAKDAENGKASHIDVTSHTDRAGSEQYNMKLSERRASSVRAELVKLDIPESMIGLAWRGEGDPSVPTPDGVKEPQNRRATILIGY